MDKIINRAMGLAMAISVLAFPLSIPLQAVQAQAPLEATQILIGVPATPVAGGTITVQALLADSKGHPISKAPIYFTTSAKFLSDKSNVVLAEAVTNAKGQAVAKFADNFSGAVALQAEFRGDTQYAPSNATTQIGAAGDGQVYAEHVGVDLPGYNVPPMSAPMASMSSAQQGLSGFVQRLWPAMNGWPIAAVLLLVWSTYFFAVTFVFRVAGLGSEDENAASSDARRSV